MSYSMAVYTIENQDGEIVDKGSFICKDMMMLLDTLCRVFDTYVTPKLTDYKIGDKPASVEHLPSFFDYVPVYISYLSYFCSGGDKLLLRITVGDIVAPVPTLFVGAIGKLSAETGRINRLAIVPMSDVKEVDGIYDTVTEGFPDIIRSSNEHLKYAVDSEGIMLLHGPYTVDGDGYLSYGLYLEK